MGGFVLDVFVAFTYKSINRLFRFIESIRWAKKAAFVLECSVIETAIGCPLVKIQYQVTSEKESGAVAEEEIPFISSWDAKRYARKFAANREVQIRVHPTYATETYFFEFDQKTLKESHDRRT